MLVVQRKINESIMIGDDVQIFVLEVTNGKVRIGIKADRSVPVHRRELYDQIKKLGNDHPKSDALDLEKISKVIDRYD
jgi:carbon storage regulator